MRLAKASREEIREEVADLVRYGQEDGGLISVSCVGIDSNMPDEQIRYFLEACRDIRI